jgi:hypothetical protein
VGILFIVSDLIFARLAYSRSCITSPCHISNTNSHESNQVNDTKNREIGGRGGDWRTLPRKERMAPCSWHRNHNAIPLILALRGVLGPEEDEAEGPFGLICFMSCSGE